MMRSPNSFEQRTQQQERVAVLAADVLAVDEHARVGAQRVAHAEHHRLEERAALRVERQAGLERRQRRGQRSAPGAAPGSSTSTRARGGSSANTPTPAGRGFGHGAVDDRARLLLDQRLGLALECDRARRALMTPSASSLRRVARESDRASAQNS